VFILKFSVVVYVAAGLVNKDAGPILSVFPALIVHPGFPVAFIF